MKQITTLVIHHSASGRDTTTLGEISHWHIDRGWKDIGYHYVIEGSGIVRIGRRLPETGAHAPPNADRIGVCVTGDNTVTGELWNAEQIAALHTLVNALRVVVPWIEVTGHRDVMAPGYTECPGLDIEALF